MKTETYSSLARQLRGDVGAGRRREEHQRPHAGRRKLHQPDRAEGRARLREQRLEHLLQAAIDRPHDRHALQNRLADLDQRAADQVGGEEAEHGQRQERDDQAEARNLDRQIGFRPVGDRDERPHQIVDPGDERPDQPDRDRERPGDDQSGQEIVADAAARRRDAAGSGAGLRRSGTVRDAHRSSEAFGLSDPSRPGHYTKSSRRPAIPLRWGTALCRTRCVGAMPIRRSPTWPDCAAGRRPCPS